MLRIVDISLDIYDKAPTFWPDPKTAILPHLCVPNMGYNITQIIMSTHLGTHLDAPFHFFDNGKTVEQLDLRRAFGPAWVIELRHKQAKEEITVADLEPYADKITQGSRIILRTGWDKQFPHPHYFSEQPFLGIAACEWLVDRGLATVAMDMPTIYPGEFVKVHHILLGAEVLVIEGLGYLERLSQQQVILIALPLRIQGRDGSPCRAIALEGDLETDFPGAGSIISN